MIDQSLAHSAHHRFVVAEVDELKTPIRTLEVVEGPDRDAAIATAFSIARQYSHEETTKAFAVIQITEDGSYLDRVAVAGFSRLSLRMPKVDLFGVGLDLVGVG